MSNTSTGLDLGMDLGNFVRTVRLVLARDGVRHSEDAGADMPGFMGTEATEVANGEGE